MRDVIVIGGGPGGLYAAWCLARKGMTVAVVEEHASTGEPVHCTGILGTEAYEEFELPKEAVLNELRAVRFYSPSGQTVEYSTDSIQAVAIDRSRFDQCLSAWAQQAGAELCLGRKVTNVATYKTHVEVECSSTPRVLHARACIFATGANYALQRRLGLGFPAVYLNSAQLEAPAAPLEDVEVHFGSELAPKGFAWVVPIRRDTGSYARIGLMCDGSPAHYFERFLARVRPRWRIQTEGGMVPHNRILPLAPIRKTYGERLLVIGDAAGLVKPTTGGGIYYSILSAAIAADVLSDALGQDHFATPALGEYETRWRRRLTEELQAQLTLRLLAQRLTDPEIEALFDLANTDGLMPLVRKTAKFNHHRDLIAALVKHHETRKILFRRLIR